MVVSGGFGDMITITIRRRSIDELCLLSTDASSHGEHSWSAGESLSFQYHPSKNVPIQTIYMQQGLEDEHLGLVSPSAHPHPPIRKVQRYTPDTLHYVTPSSLTLSGPSPRPNISSKKWIKPKPFKPDVSGAAVAGNADDAVRLCHQPQQLNQPHQESRLACQKGDTHSSTAKLKTLK